MLQLKCQDYNYNQAANVSDLSVVYLCVYLALCGVRVVVHLVGEQRHEERQAGDASGARLGAVEGLGRQHISSTS